MSCFLFNLRFTAPVHFGLSDAALSLYASEETFCADTLFSALCHTALRAEGTAGVERLCSSVQKGELKLSDAMPYRGETLYLPKPFFHAPSSETLSSAQRKTVKKLRWLPVCDFEAFSDSVRGGKLFVPEDTEAFGVHEEHAKVAVADNADAEPYQVGAFRFRENCGLWFMLCCPAHDGDYYETLLRLLGMSGIGGKISAGYGSFELDDVIFLDEPFDEHTEWLSEALSRDSSSYLLLTTALPDEHELESALDGAFYQLTRRSGFVQSEAYADTPRKKDTQFFLSAGSVLKRRFSGGLLQVGNAGKHRVYRYSSPVLLGVPL